MSREYLLYLEEHKNAVKKSFEFIRDTCPELLKEDENVDYEWHICINHDISKYEQDEFDAYDKYFYGGNKSYQVVRDFKYAWLHHIHNNPHHWQHWILENDDEGVEILDMPYVYIIEMICDWWSFSWIKGDPNIIFGWYEERKDKIQLSDATRKTVESILETLKVTLTIYH